MHMADALLAPAVAATMYVASGAAAGVSIHQLRKDDEQQKLPTMAVTAALVFAGQMINYTIPGTGSSGHMCGGMMLSALLGPYGGFLSMIVILAIQCLFFADGGLMALGCNIWMSSLKALLAQMMMRMTFIPPAVLPAHEPIAMMTTVGIQNEAPHAT